jgi:hypothetical protein
VTVCEDGVKIHEFVVDDVNSATSDSELALTNGGTDQKEETAALIRDDA